MKFSSSALKSCTPCLMFFVAVLGTPIAKSAAPVITSGTTLDVFYNIENPAEAQFAYRIQATGATAYSATGLPATAFIDGSTGWINGSRNTPGLYAVAVTASNAEGPTRTILNLAIHPAVTGVVSSRGSFHIGQTFNVTLAYNAAMVVTGTPRLSIAVGAAGAIIVKEAAYVSGSGTKELVFQYLVTAGDDDADGVQLLPSAPTGGTIADAASGLVASSTLPVRYFASGITIQAATTASTGAASAATLSNGSLANVSARMRVVEGDANRSLIAGFVIEGSAPKRVLLRAVGPALTAFGVSGALVDPQLRLYSSSGTLIASNDNWSGNEAVDAAATVGAFALTAGARDAAIVTTLQPGSYTLAVAPNGGDGIALGEVYDADTTTTAASSSIRNLSTRGQVDGDSSPLIVGFTVRGTGTQRVLIRGIGPTLANFGVSSVLLDPTLTIYRDGQLVAQNDNWSTGAADVNAATAATGAFALAAGSKDAAIVLSLAPGAYTAVVSGVGATSGSSLVEVYNVPQE